MGEKGVEDILKCKWSRKTRVKSSRVFGLSHSLTSSVPFHAVSLSLFEIKVTYRHIWAAIRCLIAEGRAFEVTKSTIGKVVPSGGIV